MGLEDQHALNGAGLFVANSLRGEGHDASEEGTGRQNLIAFSAKDHGGDAGEISPTIRAGGHNGSHANARVMQAIAIQETANRDRGGPNGRGWKDDDSAFTLEARRAQTVAFDTTQITSKENGSNPQPGDPCHPLAAGAHAPAIANAWAVRRLMPVECERLQGFPDGYTNIPYRGRNTTPDGPRYKAIGNSKAINVVRWIGRRIEWVNSH